MQSKYKVALAMIGSFALGAAAIECLHAQAKPPAYTVAEIAVTDKEGFTKEFLPAAGKAIEDAGGTYVVRAGRTVSFVGASPESRVVVLKFDNMDKAQAWWDSPGRKETQPTGDKYAKFRVFAVEGVSP